MKSMEVIKQAAELLKTLEGCRLKPYKDSAGIWTIGYGHTGPGVGPGVIFTQAQADKYLMDDLIHIADSIDSSVKVPLNNNQSTALLSLAFNIGPNAFKKSTLLATLNRGDYDGAAARFGQWIFAGKKQIQGLINRRKIEADLFRRSA